MAILYGTQSNGETLPVLVDQFGNLLAKGIDGAQGPPGEQGQQGQQGIPGQPGAPGAGVPTPYGEEGSYLWIKDGSPAWTTGSDPGPSPEIGTITLDNDQPWVDSYYKRGFYNEAEFQPVVTTNYDELMRANPVWSNPNSDVKQGMGCQNTGSNDEIYLYFSFDTTEGNIIRFYLNYRMGSSDLGQPVEASMSCSDLNFAPIRSTWTTTMPNVKYGWIHEVYEYMILRPIKNHIQFTFQTPSKDWGDYFLAKYEIETPQAWLFKQELARQQKINTALIRSQSA